MNLKPFFTSVLSSAIVLVGFGFMGGDAIAANPAHVQRLLKTNQCPLCDLSGADLREANLYGVNLVGANLKGADLSGANLGSANLTDADLSEAKLVNTYFYRATLENTNFDRANLTGAYLRDTLMIETRFTGANLSQVNLSKLNMSGVNLSGANLQGANFNNTMLSGVRFQVDYFSAYPSALILGQLNRSICEQTLDARSIEEASEYGFILAFADLSDVNLENANLKDAILVNANLKGANLKGANLQGACLRGSQLQNATLEGADLKDAILIDAVIAGANFKDAQNSDLSQAVQDSGQVQSQRDRARQSEAKNYLGAMNRAQQAYFLEMGKFSSTLKDLQLGIRDETENYLYRTFAQGKDDQQRAINAAIAKVDGLRSYIGFVGLDKSSQPGELISTAFICESEEPTKRLPSREDLSNLRVANPCPPGYKRLNP